MQWIGVGCDSGFGHLLALQLDSLGFKVFAGCLQVNGSGAQALKNSSSKHLQLVQLDVTDHAQVNAALQLINRTLRDQSNDLKICLPIFYLKLIDNFNRIVGRRQQCWSGFTF